jgi:methionyl-tRNA formyltransferase
MRVVFAGTPEFAVPSLRALRAAGHDIRLVLTQPDRPAGRHLGARASPVKQAAQELGLTVYQPSSLKTPEALDQLDRAQPVVIVVVAYGLLLPPAVLALPPEGAINVHASLLPRWRGAAPIQRAILAGDRETGISIMQMDAGLDTGAVLLQEAVAIAEDDTAASLSDKLAPLGAAMITRVLAPGALARWVAQPQPAFGVTYAPKVNKSEAVLNWNLPAEVVARTVRAFDPWPGAATWSRGELVKLWRARALAEEMHAPPGTVIAAGDDLRIACGSGLLAVSEMQRPGGRRLPTREFLRGWTIRPGDRLALSPPGGET